MKYFAFILVALTPFTLVAQERSRSGLTPIERSSCNSYPKFMEVGEMRPRFDYEFKVEYDDEFDLEVRVVLTYVFRHSLTVDYYNNQGRLVTTKTDTSRLKREFHLFAGSVQGKWDVLSNLPQNEEAKKQADEMLIKVRAEAEEEVQRTIYQGDVEACADSYYR